MELTNRFDLSELLVCIAKTIAQKIWQSHRLLTDNRGAGRYYYLRVSGLALRHD